MVLSIRSIEMVYVHIHKRLFKREFSVFPNIFLRVIHTADKALSHDKYVKMPLFHWKHWLVRFKITLQFETLKVFDCLKSTCKYTINVLDQGTHRVKCISIREYCLDACDIPQFFE